LHRTARVLRHTVSLPSYNRLAKSKRASTSCVGRA
jgi:hypothetical protein